MDDDLLLSTKRFQVVRRSHTTSDEQIVTREIVRHPGAAVLLPILDDGRVVLVRNYRMAVGKWLIELPAGTLDPGESPAETARRELAEETGYRAKSMEPLTAFYPSPGILDERMHVFVATGLEAGPTHLDAGEEIEVMPVAWQEALAMARDGRIEDAKTIAAILFYELFRQQDRL